MSSESQEKVNVQGDKRAPNFSKCEEQLLISLVEKYKNIIECKKSNVLTWKDKEKAWFKIQSEFNSKNSGNAFRSVKHLKEKYNNLKKETKKKFALEKFNASKTGGGPFVPIKVTDVNLAIKDILGEQVSGLQNSYDCDSQNINTMLDEPSEINSSSTSTNCVDKFVDHDHEVYETYFLEEEIDEQGNKENIEESSFPANDWTTYCSKNLKNPVSEKLVDKSGKEKKDQRSLKRSIGENNNIIAEKLNFIKLQKEKFLEEYNIKMEILKLKKEIKEKKLQILRKM